jgi:hypothetical protein
LGGYDAIAAVTDEFIARLAGDKQLVRWQLPAQACGISNKTRFSESHLIGKFTLTNPSCIVLFILSFSIKHGVQIPLGEKPLRPS